MAETVWRLCAGLVFALVLAGLGGCARPIGDLGRARPSFTHDRILPAIGEARATAAGEGVSSFNQSDAEREMHNRIWRFQTSQRGEDWSFDMTSEMKRTRIGPDAGKTLGTDRYYRRLRDTEYRASPVRFRRVAADIEADLATLPATFAAVCEVEATDRQRAVALAALGGDSPKVRADVAARRHENAETIGWFTQALGFRVRSYGYALDMLLIETPHEDARVADARLESLEHYRAAAVAGRFCDEAGRGGNDTAVVRPRVLLSRGEPEGT